MSVGVSVNSPELQALQKRLLKVSHVKFTKLLQTLGATVESQTRRRIQDEKKAPSGAAWADWSEAYAKSKHGAKNHRRHPGQLRSSQGHTLLSLSGALMDSIQWSTVMSDEVEVGSNLVYANRQNKDRQFIGLSAQNDRELLQVVEEFLDHEMGIE